ncbi:hypothetical protein LJR030_000214 [Rhizobium sp. LjRoot30]
MKKIRDQKQAATLLHNRDRRNRDRIENHMRRPPDKRKLSAKSPNDRKA